MLSAPIYNGKCIPKWLEDDINKLNLKDVRLSCAIYELYNYYTNDKTWRDFPDIKLYSDYVTLCIRRLNYIDDNFEMVRHLISC